MRTAERLKDDWNIRQLGLPVKAPIMPRSGPQRVMPGRMNKNGMPITYKLLSGLSTCKQRIADSRRSRTTQIAFKKK